MDEKYFVAKIQYDLPDENTGKIKKIRRGYYETEFNLISEEPTLEKDDFIMESYKDMLEAQIKEVPAYYLWSHKRWKHPRPDNLEL